MHNRGHTSDILVSIQSCLVALVTHHNVNNVCNKRSSTTHLKWRAIGLYC